MKTLIQILFIFLISSLINFSCSFGDKYLGTWKNIVNEDLMKITKHKAGTLFTDSFEEAPDYDVEYEGFDYHCSINGNGDLITSIYDGLTLRGMLSIIHFEKTTGHLHWLSDEFEKQ